MIHDNTKRHYLHLRSMYLQWFKLWFPNHPLVNQHDKFAKLVLQTIRGTQWTRYEWYKLSALIFTKILGMVASTANKGICYWSKENNHAYVAPAIDDIIMVSTEVSLYDLICTTFDKYFDYTTTTWSTIYFPTYRIIQSPCGTSIDQYNHLHQTILNIFFAPYAVVPF